MEYREDHQMKMLSDKPGIAHLVELCHKKGLKRVVISPGSRNAPLSISFLSHGDFETHVVPDERVAAFIALGMSQLDREATILVCTSGSAMLDYAPAVAEAYYQRVPLLILTADRPEEWVDQMEGQTMRQFGGLHNYVRAEYQLPQEAQDEDSLWHNDRMVNEAIHHCHYPTAGPVHINIPLREPLYGTSGEAVNPKLIVERNAPESALSEEDIASLCSEMNCFGRVLILVGMHPKDTDLAEAIAALNDKGCVILSEATSNLAIPYIISWIDRCIESIPEQQLDDYLPELVISLGGPVVSKKIKLLFRKHRPAAHWHIDPDKAHIDMFQSLSRALQAGPVDTLSRVAVEMKAKDSGFRNRWFRLHEQVKDRQATFLESAPFSDLKAYDTILPRIPRGSIIHCANSAPVRYIQLFTNRADLDYFANRGVSGIDGCTSTAMGMAFKTERPVVLLSGDMAFRYDNNAFWLSEHPTGLKCIVVNNNGGGIFRIIPGPEESGHLDTAFEAHMDNSAEKVAQMYGLPYLAAHDEHSLEQAMEELFIDDRTMVLEVFTPRLKNAEVLQDYFKAIRPES